MASSLFCLLVFKIILCPFLGFERFSSSQKTVEQYFPSRNDLAILICCLNYLQTLPSLSFATPA
jgi:hypothetical protein